ncbi:hypothetical protein P153DRAFT_431356 [Dothidotthia symphoricarpi CBS 119687]|uniref:Uncharacterized protein n=1 Tax=Dothidotthia symphoricarpi CBS 119687 TaxID=1392245 RepID=A0A6A6ADP7_9PLEO|nr:uncharacterized protein P153DRAFT_431356 [Dothidotthia symphoricarpi CBS 119687]KAF2129393.1 hypothetical protein P153DRAFT_431356 [Dothidotthia symphoricarpi CBS 119687]
MSPHLTRRQNSTGFTCPLGGDWYACATGSNFVGCCASDPCTKGCSQGNVYQGGFDKALYGTFPDVGCGTGSVFWSCAAGTTFWGCCKSDPCAANSTCPRVDLVPAYLDRPEQFSAYASTIISSSATTSATASSSPSNSDKGSSNGAVIGGAVGGGIGAALIIGALIWFLCRKRKQRRQQQYAAAPVGENAHPTGIEKGGATNPNYAGGQYAGQSQTAPPTYTSPNPNMYPAVPHKDAPYQQYAHISDAPQELPGDIGRTPADQRYSELPDSNEHRLSELPAGTDAARAELESPQTSPTPMQTEFRRDVAKNGLGASTEDGTTRR